MATQIQKRHSGGCLRFSSWAGWLLTLGQVRPDQVLQCSLGSGSTPSLDSLSQCCAVLLVKNCSEPLRSSLWSCISPFSIAQKSFALSSFCLPFQVVWLPHCQTKPVQFLQPLLPVVSAPDPCQFGDLLTLWFFLELWGSKDHLQYSRNLTRID